MLRAVLPTPFTMPSITPTSTTRQSSVREPSTIGLTTVES